MNVLAICDMSVPADLMRDALARLGPRRLDVVEWACANRRELHRRARRIERLGPDCEKPPDAIWPLVPQAELIVTHMCPIGTDLIRRATKLRMIGVCRAGTENIASKLASQRQIGVHNVTGRNAVAVAELTVGLILAECRNIARAHQSLATGGWRTGFVNSDQPGELAGKTVGLVGFGQIGKLVGRRLAAFDVRVLVQDPLLPHRVIQNAGATPVSLDRLLAESDFVSLHARYEPGPPPLVGTGELALMKPTAYLINTARAYLVDMDGLIDALSGHRIAGAALDVYDEEPLPADAALRRLDNVTLTPHLAGTTTEAFQRSGHLLVDRILNALETEAGQSKTN